MEKGMWEGQGQRRYHCTRVCTTLRIDASWNHPTEVPVPSCRGHRRPCGLSPGAARTLAASGDALTAPPTATALTSLSHFPPYPPPDSHLASSLLLAVMQTSDTHLLLRLLFPPVAAVPVEASAGRGPGLSLPAFGADG